MDFESLPSLKLINMYKVWLKILRNVFIVILVIYQPINKIYSGKVSEYIVTANIFDQTNKKIIKTNPEQSLEAVDQGLPEIPSPLLHRPNIAAVGFSHLYKGKRVSELLAYVKFLHQSFPNLLFYCVRRCPELARLAFKALTFLFSVVVLLFLGI